jgi:hypothetical protein
MSTIKIKPSKRGSFTAWAKKHGMSVAEATSTVLAHKDRYSTAIEKKAQFARNFGGHAYGGYLVNRFQDLTDDVHPYGVHGFGGTLTALNHPVASVDGKPIESYTRKTPPQYKHGGKINGAVGWGGYVDNNKYDTGILEKAAYGGFIGNHNFGMYDNAFQTKNTPGLPKQMYGGFSPKARSVGNTPLPIGMLGIDLNRFRRSYGNDFGSTQNTGLDFNQGQSQSNIPQGINTNGMAMGAAMGAASSMASGANAGDTAYNTAMGVVGNIPVVGTAIGIGDSIGNPIRQKSEQYDPTTGGLKNKDKAARNAQVGFGLNPAKAASMTLFDKNASSGEKWGSVANVLVPGVGRLMGLGNKRANRLDSDGRKKFSENIIQNNNDMFTEMLNQNLRGYESGGQMDLYPAKDVIEYKGNEHQQGGIKVDGNGNATAKTGLPAIAEVEDGEMNWGGYVFSNKLSYGKR